MSLASMLPPAPPGMDTVLMCAYQAGELQMMLEIGTALRTSGVRQLLILAPANLNGWQWYARKTAQAGIRMLPCPGLAKAGTKLLGDVAKAFAQARPQHMAEVPLPASLPPSLREKCPTLQDFCQHAEVQKVASTLRRCLSTALTLIDMLHVDALVLGESNILTDTPLWIGAMQRRARPSFVLSLGEAAPNCGIDVVAHWPDHSVHTPLAACVAEHLPHWTARDYSPPVLALPAPTALAMELFDIVPEQPWQFNNGRQTALIVNGEHARKSFVAEGFASENVLALGHPLMDVLHERMRHRAEGRKNMCRQLGFSEDKPLVIIFLPNNKTLATITEQFGADHTVLGHLVGACFASQDWNVALAPHVASNANQFPLLETPHWRVINTPAMDILPYADLVAGYGSSVEYWARALGIPDIVYAPFAGYGALIPAGEGHFEALTVDSLQKLAALLRPPARLAALCHVAQRHAAYWGVLDGKCTQRILQHMFDIHETGTQAKA